MSTSTTSCFFCQNLLSDYLEGILPSSRHEQIRSHLDDCKECTETHKDLETTIELLHSLPLRSLSHEMALRVTEASEARRTIFLSRRRVSRFTLFVALPVLLFTTAVLSFPNMFPWLNWFHNADGETQFVRYFPLLQGASDIIEEQGTWLHSRETLMGSLWEEGGMSPEEFEKTFQVKGAKPEAEDK